MALTPTSGKKVERHTEKLVVSDNGVLIQEQTGSVNASGTVEASALLEMESVTKGLLIPRMTTAERDLISSPAESLMIYNTSLDEHQWYDLANTTWQSLGGGGGGGGGGSGAKNYFEGDGTFGEFEAGTTGVSVYDDGGAYVDGTGGTVGSEVQAIITTTAGQVQAGTQSLRMIKSTSDSSGFGWSFALNDIDEADKGKDLVLSMSTDVNANFITGDIEIKAYDITNASIITGIRTLSGGSDGTFAAGKLKQRYAIPTLTSTDQLRISFHILNDNSVGTAYNMYVDEFRFGPEDPIQVANVSDFQDYTPTFNGFGTPTVEHARWKVVGDSLHLQVQFNNAVGTASLGTVSLPSNFTADVSHDDENVGWWTHQNSGSSNIGGGVLLHTDDSSVVYFGVLAHNANPSISLTRQNGGFADANTTIGFSIEIPLLNHSSNLGVGTATTFTMSSILANGTRTSGADPTTLGEYRTLTRDSAAQTFSDTDGSSKVTAADGMQIYSVNGTSAGTSTEPNRYVINVGGPNKRVQIIGWENSGRSGGISFDHIISGTSTYAQGLDVTKPDENGNVVVTLPILNNSTTTRAVGAAIATGTSAQGSPTDAYFDIVVSENVQAIGFQPRSRRVEETLAADQTGTGVMTDLSVTTVIGQSYTISGKVKAIDDADNLTDIAITVDVLDGAAVVERLRYRLEGSGQDIDNAELSLPLNVEYTATSAALTFDVTVITGLDVQGNGTREETHVVVKESDSEVVSAF